MEVVVTKMRSLGCILWVYLDDFLLVNMDPQVLEEQTYMLLTLLAKLGIEVNLPKSNTNPAQVVQYLGFQLELAEGVVSIPRTKVTHLLADLARLHKTPSPTLRRVASVLGRLRALLVAMPQIRLLSDLLVRHLQDWCQISWEIDTPLSTTCQEQLLLAMEEVASWKGKHLFSNLPTNRCSPTLRTGDGGQPWTCTR